MKKLFAIIIAVALLSTLCMQSFAAETDNDQRFTEQECFACPWCIGNGPCNDDMGRSE